MYRLVYDSSLYITSVGQTRGLPLVGCLDHYLDQVETKSRRGPKRGRTYEADRPSRDGHGGPPMAGGPPFTCRHRSPGILTTGVVHGGVYPGRVHPMHDHLVPR